MRKRTNQNILGEEKKILEQIKRKGENKRKREWKRTAEREDFGGRGRRKTSRKEDIRTKR